MISDINSLENKENYDLNTSKDQIDNPRQPELQLVDLNSSAYQDNSSLEDDAIEGSDAGTSNPEDVVVDEVYPSSQTATKKPSIPPANEFAALLKALMKPVPDYPVKEEGHDVWEIKSWSGITDHKIRGPRFKVGNFEWNILLFPRGNSNNNYISIYIEPHPLGDVEDDWYVCAQFAFDLWNPAHPKSHFSGSSNHRFTKNETDWGFSSLIDLGLLYKPRSGEEVSIIANNHLNITAYVRIIDDSQTGVLWYNFLDYDSKKSTGYVGLTNQGATCYLNSLLQSYFTTKAFRKLVYQIPTSSNTVIKSNKKIKKQSSVALSLQKIFYLLTSSTQAVNTLELTKSFGWDTSDAFTQHDIQELNRILMDKLETSMKGTPIENRLNDLFVGKMKSFIKCINVPYESSRTEDFWDIQLNVKGFGNLEASFKNYIELEMLTDDNKYQAGDDYGYQDAKKGVVFEEFPPVLHLQLKRFEYDFMIDDLQKINDLYEYPNEIDLSPYLDEDLPKEVKLQNWNYKLHGVLVHQGSISNGHYYAMIKPKAHKDYWLRFEDGKVWKVTKSQVFEENFGANGLSQEEFFKLSKYEQNDNLIRRSTSAYMLVYYRETELDKILPDDDEEINKQVPSFIPVEIEQQLNEIKMMEDLKLQQLYNINVTLVTLSNFYNFKEFDYYYDPTNPKFYDKKMLKKNKQLQVLTLSLKKANLIYQLYNLINQNMKLSSKVETVDDVSKLPYRLLLICHRNNQTNRVDGFLNLKDILEQNAGEDSLSLSSIFNTLFNKKFDEMVFYIEEFKNDLAYVNQVVSGPTVPVNEFKFEKVIEKFEKIDLFSSNPTPPTKPLDETSNNIVIFLKFFDYKLKQLRGLTHYVVSKDETINDIIPQIRKLLGFEDSVKLELIEELTPTKLELLNADTSLEKNELSNGDILICQIASPESSNALIKYFKFLTTKIHIKVRPVKEQNPDEGIGSDNDMDDDDVIEIDDGNSESDSAEDDESHDLWISSTYSYQQLSAVIGAKVNQDPEYLRLFIINQQGYKFPMNTSSNLSQYFPKSLPNSTVVQFEYEVLTISMKEFENMKSLKVFWINKIMQYEELEILIPVDQTVDRLVEKIFEELKEKGTDLSKVNKSNLFMYCGNNSKYVDLVKFNKSIDALNELFDYYLGEFPTELSVLINYDLANWLVEGSPLFKDDIEKNEYELAVKYSKNLNIIPVFHFYKNSNYHHSIPFLFVLFPNEVFKDTKKRLQNKLGLDDQNFNKIKFALADSNDKGKYLDDDEALILYNEVSSELSSLALDHVDKNPKKNIFDKGIQIK